MTAAATVRWHTLPIEETLTRLGSSSAGLSSAEAALRLARDGRNQLASAAAISRWTILRRQFSSLIVWILIVAGMISGFVGEWIDAIAILSIIVLNAAIGFFQENNAERSLAALKQMTAPRAKVRRDGQLVDLDAGDVVPGDVIALEAGDVIPADARLLRAASLRCIESALTGEAEAVDKDPEPLANAEAALGDRFDLVFMGTTVAGGTADAVIVETGMRTEIGRIADLLTSASGSEATPIQRKLAVLGRWLAGATVGIVVMLFGLGLWRGNPPLELVLGAVSLAVAAVPEGLPAVVTVALAIGVQRMARRRVLVRSLPAVETLGATSVICTDKTGTLTVNEMTVRAMATADARLNVTGDGYAPEGAITHDDARPFDPATDRDVVELLDVMAGCNGASLSRKDEHWTVIGDPTEGGLLAAAAKGGRASDVVERDYPKLGELPFDSDRKRMTVFRRTTAGVRAMVKGAPDLLIERCRMIVTRAGVRDITAADVAAITAAMAEMGNRALRVLGCAYRDLPGDTATTAAPDQVERELTFVGLIGMYDPPRVEAKDAVARCREAGIRVVMITGDHPRTALAVAREIDIARVGDRALTGAELDRLDDTALKATVSEVAVYARVTAEHKLRIVRAWKANGAVAAMTGDGVNDAPAIKGADIGIAMGRTGTDVTKEASDMVVLDDDFASIVAAVEEGRGIYDNIRKTLQYLLGGNVGELLLMTICVVAGLPMPLLPIHLLWINLVTDGIPALCLATDPIDPDVMKRAPRPATEELANGRFFIAMCGTGMLTAGVTLAVFLHELRSGDLDSARTHAFATLVFAELLRSFGARSETKPVWRMGFATNLRLVVVVGASIALQIASHHVGWLGAFLSTSPMDLVDCLRLLVIGAIPLAVLEAVKVIRRAKAAAPRTPMRIPS